MAGNTGAAGAKISIYAPGTNQLLWYEQVATYDFQVATSYYGRAQTERHFGLGTRSTVDVVVEFPQSGHVTRINNVAANQTINVLESPSPQPALPGDYNQSAKVDGGDYVLWRKTLGSSVATYSGADGNGDGHITEADYAVWRANFGNTAPGAGGAALPADATAPELVELVSEPIAIYYATSLTFEPVPAIQAQLASIATHSDPFVRLRSLDAALGALADSRSLGIRPARQVDRNLEVDAQRSRFAIVGIGPRAGLSRRTNPQQWKATSQRLFRRQLPPGQSRRVVSRNADRIAMCQLLVRRLVWLNCRGCILSRPACESQKVVHPWDASAIDRIRNGRQTMVLPTFSGRDPAPPPALPKLIEQTICDTDFTCGKVIRYLRLRRSAFLGVEMCRQRKGL